MSDAGTPGILNAMAIEASEAKLVLSATDVARELGVSRQHVHVLRRDGLLPATRVSRGATRSVWRWVASDIAAYLDSINERAR